MSRKDPAEVPKPDDSDDLGKTIRAFGAPPREIAALPEYHPRVPGEPRDTSQEASLAAERVVGGKKDVLKRLELKAKSTDRFIANWPTTPEELQKCLLEGSGGIESGNHKLIADRVRLRREADGTPINTLRKGETLAVADDANRIEVDGVSFIQVECRGIKGFIAEEYLEPLSVRMEVAERKKEKLDVSFVSLVRETIRKRAGANFDRIWPKFNAAYEALEQGRSLPKSHGIAEIYKREFAGADLFVDIAQAKINEALDGKREFEIAVLSENLYEKTPAEQQRIIDAMLSTFAYELGIYYFGNRPMTLAEIETHFSINSALPPGGWGEKGSRIVFNYRDGNLYFYPPKEKAQMVSMEVPTSRLVADYGPGGRAEFSAVELQGTLRKRTERPLAMKSPGDRNLFASSHYIKEKKKRETKTV